MLNFGGRRYFLATKAIDMRCGIPRLSLWVESQEELTPFTGDLFIFLSKDCRRVKVLVWETGGYWLCAKTLTNGRFARPVPHMGQDGRPVAALSAAELGLLLEGISVHRATYSKHGVAPLGS